MSIFRLSRKLKATHKLALSFLTIILLILGLVYFSHSSVQQLKEVSFDSKNQARETVLVANIMEDVLEARLASLNYRLKGLEDEDSTVSSNMQEVADTMEGADKYVTDPAIYTRLKELQKRTQEYATTFEAFKTRQSRLGRNVTDNRLDQISDTLNTLGMEIIDGYDEINEAGQERKDILFDRSEEIMAKIARSNMIFGTVITLLAILFAVLMSVTLSRSFLHIEKRIKEVTTQALQTIEQAASEMQSAVSTLSVATKQTTAQAESVSET